MVQQAPKQILELLKLGVKFSKKENKLAVTKEAGHGLARIVHSKDSTGRVIEQALVHATKNHPNITIYENTLAFDLIVKNKICIGAHSCRQILPKQGLLRKQNEPIQEILTFESKVVILATGGIGQLYKHNTNPAISTGDGIAMAYNAGAELEDLEFIQFHPTMLDLPRTRFLISETVRGEGGYLFNANHERFMEQYHEMKELAPRDTVARAIVMESKKGPVYLSIAHKDPRFIKKRFPMIYQRCKKLGIDITNDQIPVVPAAHYICGGIKTDYNGRTSVTGLYAFGETACTGVHGANRLASNSLLESLVFSERAYRAVKEYLDKNKTNSVETKEITPCEINACNLKTDIPAKKLKGRIKQIMWQYVGIVRQRENLKHAARLLDEIEKDATELWNGCLNRDIIEAKNMALVGKLIALSAYKRKESRGTHYLVEFPNTKEEWKKHITIVKKSKEKSN